MLDERRIIAETKENLIKRFAFNFYQIRQRCNLQGSAEQDWKDGEEAYESYCNMNNMLDRRKL